MRSAKYHTAQRRKHLRIAKRHGVAERKARRAADRRAHHKIRARHLHLARVELRLARAARARARAAERRRKRRASSGGVSHLTAKQRSHARRRAVQAAWLACRNRGVVHYTQGGSRWQGINAGLQSRRGQFPRYADCSSLATWCIWNGIKVAYGARDTVNNLAWRAGYTGTMLVNGSRVRSLMPGDCIIYGRGHPGSHTAIYVGNGKVISHGSEAGPLLLPWRYRGDVIAVRRYI